MKCSFHLTTSGATWYLCLIVLSTLITCKVLSIKFSHLQVILFPFLDTLVGHHVQYTLQGKGIDFGSYWREECQRICGFMLKLVPENKDQEDGHVPGVWRVPGTGCQVRVLAWESHGHRSLAGLPSYRKEFKNSLPQQSKSRFI